MKNLCQHNFQVFKMIASDGIERLVEVCSICKKTYGIPYKKNLHRAVGYIESKKSKRLERRKTREANRVDLFK